MKQYFPGEAGFRERIRRVLDRPPGKPNPSPTELAELTTLFIECAGEKFGYAVGLHSIAANEAIEETVRQFQPFAAQVAFYIPNLLDQVRAHLEQRARTQSARASGLHELRKKGGPTTKTDEPVKATQKRGPKPDHETASRVAEIVGRIGGKGWRAKLDDICCELDEAKVARPKTWKNKGYGTWFDCLTEARALVVKAIEHHLELARPEPETFS